MTYIFERFFASPQCWNICTVLSRRNEPASCKTSCNNSKHQPTRHPSLGTGIEFRRIKFKTVLSIFNDHIKHLGLAKSHAALIVAANTKAIVLGRSAVAVDLITVRPTHR